MPAQAEEVCKYHMQRLDFWYSYKDITGLAGLDGRAIFSNSKSWSVYCTVNLVRKASSYCQTSAGGGSVEGVNYLDHDTDQCVVFDGFFDKKGAYIQSKQKTCFSHFSNALISSGPSISLRGRRRVAGGKSFSDSCSLKGGFWAVDHDTRYNPSRENYRVGGYEREAYVGRQMQACYGIGVSLHEGPKGEF